MGHPLHSFKMRNVISLLLFCIVDVTCSGFAILWSCQLANQKCLMSRLSQPSLSLSSRSTQSPTASSRMYVILNRPCITSLTSSNLTITSSNCCVFLPQSNVNLSSILVVLTHRYEGSCKVTWAGGVILWLITDLGVSIVGFLPQREVQLAFVPPFFHQTRQHHYAVTLEKGSELLVFREGDSVRIIKRYIIYKNNNKNGWTKEVTA